MELTNLTGPHGEAFGDLIGPHGVEFFDGEVWFTAEGSKKIARYDLATNRVDWVHEVGENRTHMLVISREGHTIYTSNVNSDSVTAVVASADEKKWFNTVIPVGKLPITRRNRAGETVVRGIALSTNDITGDAKQKKRREQDARAS